MYEQPYFAVFDADIAAAGQTPLTDGLSYQNLQVNLNSDADFLLRRIAGVNNCATSFRLFNQTGAYLQSKSIIAPVDYLCVPQQKYNLGSQIRFDLYNVNLQSRSYGVGGSINNYWSQIAFQGVKVFPNLSPYETPYKYYLRPFAYTQSVTVSNTGRIASAYQGLQGSQQITVEMHDYDFELQYIELLITLSGGSQIVSDTYVKIMLYDQYQSQFFSRPVLDSYINYTSANNSSVWPCPTIVYPVGSFIRFDVWSLLTQTQVPATLQVTFGGMWRKAL